MPDRDGEFVPVSIEEFLTGKALPYALFIRISSWKYLKIVHPGDSLDRARLEVYRDRNVTKLYMEKDDFARYSGLVSESRKPAPAPVPINAAETAPGQAPANAVPPPGLLSALSNTNQETARKKAAELMSRTEIALELIKVNGLNAIVYETAAELVKSTVTLLCTDTIALRVMAAMNVTLPGGEGYHYQHCLGTCMYSVMIGRMLGWRNSVLLFNLGTGALLHEVGMQGLEATLYKPEHELSPAELKNVRSHPDWGADLIVQLAVAPADVATIILQHHENCLGTGYPGALPASKIHPLAKVVSAADRFCELVLEHPRARRLLPFNAIKEMSESRQYDAAVLGALDRIIKGMAEPD